MVAQKVSHFPESSLNRIKTISLDFSSILSIKWVQEYYKFVKYSMCDLIYDVE